MTIGAFLGAILPKLGIDTASANLAEVLALGLDIPDNMAVPLVTQITAVPLLTMEAAQNNQQLKNKFKAEALNAVDVTLGSLMTEYQLADDVVSEINGTGNTYQKIPALVKKIHALEVAKSAATSKEKPELTNQINALNQRLADIQASTATTIAQKDQQHLDEMSDMLLLNTIRSKNLNTSVFPLETVVSFAEQLVKQELQKKGVKIKNVNRTLQLKQAAEEALDYYDTNNSLVTVDALVDQVLANNKLIAVTSQAQVPAPGNNGQQPIIPTQQNQNAPRVGMSSKLDAALADFHGPKGIV